MTSGMLTHPAADLFPLLEGEELAELAEDIGANGQHEPVWLYDDPDLGTVVLDGRNRLAACAHAGVEPRTQFYRGDDPITFSLSLNIKRRHLTAGQRADVGLRILPMYEAEAAREMVEAGRASTRTDLTPVADLPQGSEEPPAIRDPAEYLLGSHWFQDWHRRSFDETAGLIDVDGLGYCRSCSTPLFVVEATRWIGYKPATLCVALARALGIPAYVLTQDRRGGHPGQIHVENRTTRKPSGWLPETEVIAGLRAIRSKHKCA